MKKELRHLEIDANQYIALWKVSSEKSKKSKNILLTHGTFSNKKVLMSISEYMTTHGFTCWIFEWRNHGDSSSTQEDFNFETIGKEDFKIVFDYLLEVEKIEKLDCITHSGGGICLTIALVNYPYLNSKINSITLFACQAFGAGQRLSNYVKIGIGKWLSRWIGYVPARLLASEENESYFFMKQWFDWNLKGLFYGQNGMNYLDEMQCITVPVFSIYGKGDTFIAPKIGCELFLSAFKNPSNEFLFGAKENGFQEDYSHSRILHSRNARKEIYPLVYHWITKNS